MIFQSGKIQFGKTKGALPTALVALLSFSSTLHADVLDQSLAAMAQATAQGNYEGFVDGLERATLRFGELYEQYVKEGEGALDDIGDAFDLAGKALAQEPLELGELYATIQEDTNRIDGSQPKAPPFGDPLRGVPADDLESTDPIVRGRALDKVRMQGNELRDAYQRKLDEYSAERVKAVALKKHAEAVYDRGHELTQTLEDINNSPAGAFFNIGGNKLVYTILDMHLYIRPALGGRSGSIGGLVQRYDDAIVDMKRMLNRYDIFHDWANYYRLQDWARENIRTSQPQGAAAAKDDPIKPLPGYEATKDRVKDAVNEGLIAETNPLPTPHEIKANQLAHKLLADTTATQEQVRKLLQDAAREADKEATIREYTALVNLAGTFYGLGGAANTQPNQSASPPPQQPSLILMERTVEFRPIDLDPAPDSKRLAPAR